MENPDDSITEVGHEILAALTDLGGDGAATSRPPDSIGDLAVRAAGEIWCPFQLLHAIVEHYETEIRK